MVKETSTCTINDVGDKVWSTEFDVLHREDGPAIEWPDGTTFWYQHGNLHREDGPAIDHTSGYGEWWFNNILHRADGPAVVYKNGTKEWWFNGIEYTDPLVYWLAVSEWKKNKG